MPAEGVDFELPDLAAAVDGLSREQMDALPFGVIALDRLGTILLYNRTELAQSGYRGADPVGQDFFRLGRLGSGAFRERIEQAWQRGQVDLEIGWFGDYSDPGRALRVRVQSGGGGKLWLFIQRDPVTATGEATMADVENDACTRRGRAVPGGDQSR